MTAIQMRGANENFSRLFEWPSRLRMERLILNACAEGAAEARIHVPGTKAER